MIHKGQGSIEYLLILGAIIVVASIITMLIMNFTFKGPEQMYEMCQNAIKLSIATKAASILNYKSVDEVKVTCMPCYNYDRYFLSKYNVQSDVDQNDIMAGPLSFVDYTQVQTYNGKILDIYHYPNYLVCLTTTASGTSQTAVLASAITSYFEGSGSSSGKFLIGKIKINNPNTDLYGYQVRINIKDIVTAHGNKLSFYDDDMNILSYCFEQSNGECNQTPSNTVWIKTHHLKPGENTIYVLGGSTTGLTDGKGVFDFYDDFKVLDTNVWNKASNTKNLPFVSNGELYLANKNGYYYSHIWLKNKILSGKNEEIFIKYYLSSDYINNGENDWWINYPDDYSGHWFRTFEDEKYEWVRTKSWDNNPSWIYWLPGGSALRDNWTGISIAREGKNLYLKYYKPWNNLYKSYILQYTGSSNLDSLFGSSGLSIGTCCGTNRILKIDFIRARKYVPDEPTVTTMEVS